VLGPFRRLALGSSGAGAPALFVVVPARGAPVLADGPRHLVAGLAAQAQGFAGRWVPVLAADAAAERLWSGETGRPRSLSILRHPVTLLMGPAFLLGDPPPIEPLLAAALRGEVAWSGWRSTADACAVALPGAAVDRRAIWDALRRLTACVGDGEGLPATGVLVPPAATSPENSPALDGIDGATGRRSFDGPVFLNTALREMLTAPQDRAPVAGYPERMATVLAAQRDVSRVPWVFNTWLNDVEYRLGAPRPRSVPPEIHLSVTGLCNIECRFCAYEHALARRDFVDAERVARLDVLRFAQTFRLHSGLGEPTANRHLPAIIEHVATRFPHVGMNFFTNAVTLNRPGLIEAMVGNVRWINASLNAASRASWRDLCKADLYDRVTASLRALRQAKRDRRRLHPIVFGSMVLTRANLEDLPRMPALCAELGIDRLTAFPYFGLGYHGHDKYGPEMTLESCRERYDALWEPTARQAEKHGISLEIPLPGAQKRTAFGMEARPLHDFARVESNEWKLGRFVQHHLRYAAPAGAYCHYPWRTAAIGSTNNTGHAAEDTHYLYPCIGPLSSLDLSRRTAFRFPDAQGFQQLWHNPVFELLRRAQREPGVSPVCDVCRATDTRDPKHFPLLQRLVADFAREHCGVPEHEGPRTAPPHGIDDRAGDLARRCLTSRPE
jgi:molybdenum cofactor biosynthesis enzyme MoaA